MGCSNSLDRRLPRAERLRGQKRLEKLFGEGLSGFVHPFRYVWLSRDATADDTAVAVMASAPKRNHKRANRRNLLKRRTREAYRLNKGGLAEAARTAGVSVDLALVYSSKEVEKYATIEKAIQKILADVAAKLR